MRILMAKIMSDIKNATDKAILNGHCGNLFFDGYYKFPVNSSFASRKKFIRFLSIIYDDVDVKSIIEYKGQLCFVPINEIPMDVVMAFKLSVRIM